MSADLVRRWARANGLTISDHPFALAALASDPPAGAGEVVTPNAGNAMFLHDAEGQPAAVVFLSFGGHWLREAGDLVRCMRLSAFTPPAPREDGDKHFIIVGRPGAPEPRWLPEQR